MRKADRLLIAYGGLILLIGISLLFLSIVSIIKFIDPAPLLRRPALLIYVSLAVGVLDLICGVLLALLRRPEVSVMEDQELGVVEDTAMG